MDCLTLFSKVCIIECEQENIQTTVVYLSLFIWRPCSSDTNNKTIDSKDCLLFVTHFFANIYSVWFCHFICVFTTQLYNVINCFLRITQLLFTHILFIHSYLIDILYAMFLNLQSMTH